MSPLIQCQHVDFGYDNQDAVTDVNMEVDPGDYLCIVGENGSGKSTLMKGLLGLIRPTGVFKTTGYCPCRACSEGWGRHTCTGAVATAGHTIAVDPRVIPYGSKVMINGVVYTAEDRGGAVRGNHIDIFFNTHAETRQHGTQSAEVYLVQS